MFRTLFLVLTAMFLLVLGTYIPGTILTPYAKTIGATWFQIGILSGSMYAVRLFIGTPVGRLADRKGTLKVLKYSFLLYPFIAAAYWLSPNIYFLICARLLHGVASAMMLPMGLAYVGEKSPRGMEGKYMALYNSCMMLASGIGPLISTAVASSLSYRSTFAVLFILAIIGLLIILLYAKNCKIDNNKLIWNEKRYGSANLFKDRRMMALGVINIALAVVSSLVGFFMIPFLEERGVALMFSGSVIAVYNIVSAAIQLPLGRITDKYNKFPIVIFSGVLTAVSLLVFPFTNNILLIGTAMILTSIGSGSLLAASSALSTIIGREKGMGSTMGFLSTSTSIGMIFGCITLSYMPKIGYNFVSFFYFSSLAVIACIILFGIFWTNKGRNSKPTVKFTNLD
ncbi:MAG: MFS transporter [Bacillota bacterium]|nr:MFS transporter [Bacillota bacterium]